MAAGSPSHHHLIGAMNVACSSGICRDGRYALRSLFRVGQNAWPSASSNGTDKAELPNVRSLFGACLARTATNSPKLGGRNSIIAGSCGARNLGNVFHGRPGLTCLGSAHRSKFGAGEGDAGNSFQVIGESGSHASCWSFSSNNAADQPVQTFPRAPDPFSGRAPRVPH